MKRLISLFLLAVVVLCGCAPPSSEQQKNEEAQKQEKTFTQEELMRAEGKYLNAAGEEIALENVTPDNWYKVQLTYPVGFMSESDLAVLQESKYEKVTVDEDNRVTIVMSKAQYEELKTNCITAIQADFDACMDGSLEQVLPTIAEVQADDLCSDIRVLITGDINKSQTTQFAYYLCKSVYRQKILMGNNTQTNVVIMDKDTGAVYGELNDVQMYEYENQEK